jgi:predicted RNA-binding Zn ribbon-like protein
MQAIRTIENMQLEGGAACLDFINSAFDTEKEVIVERLHTYNDMLVLAERSSILAHSRIALLKKMAKKQQDDAIRVLQQARRVREVMFKVFSSVAHKTLHTVDDRILRRFNSYLSSALSNRVFEINGSNLQQSLKSEPLDLMEPIWGFLLSAHDLLRDKDQQYIKQCGGCEWIFIDETKNHKRKWCDMQTCGSSEKSKRYYQRKKNRADTK